MGRDYSSRRKGSRFPFSPSRREAECRPSSFHRVGKNWVGLGSMAGGSGILYMVLLLMASFSGFCFAR